MTTLRPLHQVQHDLPFTLSSVYSGFARGRYTWLRKRGPDNHKGRNLWVDVDAFNSWAENRGVKSRLGEAGRAR